LAAAVAEAERSLAEALEELSSIRAARQVDGEAIAGERQIRLARSSRRDVDRDGLSHGPALETSGRVFDHLVRVERFGAERRRSFPQPLDHAEFSYEPLQALVRFFAGNEFDFEVQLVLKREQVPGCELGRGDQTAPRLGWLTWSISWRGATARRACANGW